MDVQSSLEDAAALAALVQALAAQALESAARRGLPAEAIAESSFRASRDGIDATILHDGALRPAARGRARDGRGGRRPRARARRRPTRWRESSASCARAAAPRASAPPPQRGGMRGAARAARARHGGSAHGRPDPRADAALRRRAQRDRLGRDRRALRGRGARAAASAPSASRATTTRSCRSPGSSRARRTRTRWRSTASGAGRSRARDFPPSAIRTIHPDRPLKIVFGSCRVAVPHEAPWNLSPDEDERGREVDALYALALRMMEHDRVGVAAPAAVGRRPGLRRRGRARDARVHPLAARHEPAAGRGGRRLRGVHAPLPGVVGRRT